MTTRNLFAAALLAGYALPAAADEAAIDRCRETTADDRARIACLEAALRGDDPAVAQIDPPSLQLEAGPADVDIDAAESGNETVRGIGAAQVVARNRTREEVLEDLEEARNLRVAAYDTVPYRKLLVRLENGQVWRQIRGDTQEFRVDMRRNQTVDISESTLGGYRMRLNEMRRTIRVERVK